uniref:RNA-directed RNA polymerase n=1 Tax=Sclerotinia sclerotiorum umbra-like virus 2 TaxID=2231770 RepID=A0A7D5BQI5_9TOMB|nr:replication associated protein [Sclerotinia sclerotiorum umbra-like virus 2]
MPTLDPSRSFGCEEGKRKMYRCWVPAVDGLWAAGVHANCVHNEEAALKMRTLGPTPDEPVNPDFELTFKRLGRLLVKLQVERMTLEEVVASYTGRLRRRYQEAFESLVEEPELGKYDRRLSAFLKAEKFNPLHKRSKPRMIMCRSPRFNLKLASYLKPVEHALWRRWKFGMGGVTPTRVVGKGLNGPRRAAILKEKMDSVGDCVVFEIDGKAFEAHVSLLQIDLEHSVYKAVFRKDKELNDLLNTQRKLIGKTVGGIRYEREGCRASGDFNTGLGNTLIMGSAVEAGLRLAVTELGMFKATYLADGDNALLFVDRTVAERLRTNFARYISSVCGHEMTVEKPVDVLEHITFGQCKPCFNGKEYVMVRHPLKTLSYAFSGYRHYDQPKFTGPLLKAVCQAELSLSRGIPLLEAYFAKALAKLASYRDLKDPTSFLEERLKYGHHSIPFKAGEHYWYKGCTEAARSSFAESWGICVEEQLLLEEQLTRSLDHWSPAEHYDEVLVGNGPGDETELVGNRVDLFLGGRRLKE